MTAESGTKLKETPLTALHRALGAKMVPFAGYTMPVQFPAGVLKEHLHTRAAAGLFDVSHMGQVHLRGDGVAAALEALVPGDIQALGEGRMRYTLLLNDRAGILDDLMVTNCGDHLAVVVNAACKDADLAHLRDALPAAVEVAPRDDLALLALQGPEAASVLQRHTDTDLAALRFMMSAPMTVAGAACAVSRSGYTGEDGFEISVPADAAVGLAETLLADSEVEPIGLGARDSLRLEAGLCLYGHDIDETTTPIEAALNWAIGKRRRAEGGFPGHAIVMKQIEDGVDRLRVGIRPDGRAPAREGTELTDPDGASIGAITSGSFGPTVGGPVAMGYVASGCGETGTPISAVVRGKPLPAHVAVLPFVEQRYYRG
ncbi:MAG: glycine cleavage system aminomethyltransferase GcvT [Alphaproteobacteria bacterium]|nr:glycine cleavage system aminomethyltransferase GcvT [Alphaproteobacteria bacterium]